MPVEYWVLTAVIVVPIVYIVAILRSKPLDQGQSDVFDWFNFANKSIRPSEFIDSSVMYGLQVAAVVLFATWGFDYGFVTILVPIFWGLGYVLTAEILRRRHDLVRRIVENEDFGTLHSFISNNSKSVAALGAVITLLAISGPAMFEVVFVANTVTGSIVSQNADPNTWMIVALFMLGLSATYMLRGGFKAVVRTDLIQMAFGFGLFNVFLSIFFVAFVAPKDPLACVVLLALCAIVSVLVLVIRMRRDAKEIGSPALFPTIATWLSPIAFLCALSTVLITTDWNNSSKLDVFFRSNFDAWFTPLAVLSLFVANAFYQLVDVGQWQRLLSVSVSKAENEAGKAAAVATAQKTLSNALTRVGAFSSATWLIAIFFGIGLKYAFPSSDSYSAFALLISELSDASPGVSWEHVGIFLLIVSLSAIAYSTVDSLFSGTGFTVIQDILIAIFGDDPSKLKLFVARTTLLIVIAVQVFFYLYVRWITGDRIDDILYFCWSMQIALLAPAVAAMWGRSMPPIAIFSSIVLGVIGAAVPLTFGPFAVYEFSPWLAAIGSIVGLIVAAGALSIWRHLGAHKP